MTVGQFVLIGRHDSNRNGSQKNNVAHTVADAAAKNDKHNILIDPPYNLE